MFDYARFHPIQILYSIRLMPPFYKEHIHWYRSIINISFYFTTVRPTFLILPRNISVNETSSVNIQCTAKGPDQPIISWYRLLTNGQKMNLNCSSNELAITKVDRNDSGFYVCEARNYAGYINTTFFINVQCMYTLDSWAYRSIELRVKGIWKMKFRAEDYIQYLDISPIVDTEEITVDNCTLLQKVHEVKRELCYITGAGCSTADL